MKYYLDTEFDGPGGPLLSIALVREDNAFLYCVMKRNDITLDKWVKANVIPHIEKVDNIHYCDHRITCTRAIAEFFKDDLHPHIVADWPVDFTYLTMLLLTAPDSMIDIPSITMEVVRVESYPTDLPGAIRHNAYWDAMALKHRLTGAQTGAAAPVWDDLAP